jgi:hypothetical protein
MVIVEKGRADAANASRIVKKEYAILLQSNLPLLWAAAIGARPGLFRR